MSFATHTFVALEGALVSQTAPLGFDAVRELSAICVRDAVLSRSASTDDMSLLRVERIIERLSVPTLYVRFERGTLQLFDAIESSEDQEFHVSGKGWLPAHALAPGDQLVTLDGQAAIVQLVEPTDDVANVRDLELENFGTFFVGRHAIWARSS